MTTRRVPALPRWTESSHPRATERAVLQVVPVAVMCRLNPPLVLPQVFADADGTTTRRPRHTTRAATRTIAHDHIRAGPPLGLVAPLGRAHPSSSRSRWTPAGRRDTELPSSPSPRDSRDRGLWATQRAIARNWPRLWTDGDTQLEPVPFITRALRPGGSLGSLGHPEGHNGGPLRSGERRLRATTWPRTQLELAGHAVRGRRTLLDRR